MTDKAKEVEQKPAFLQKQNKIDEYYKMKIKEAFSLFEIKKPGFVEKEEIPSIMRFLCQFPSEAQVSDVIIPEILDEENPDFVRYNKFESYMLRDKLFVEQVMKEKEFEPDDPEVLLAAFRQLDIEKKGFLEIDLVKSFFEKEGIKFNDKESENFVKFATNNDPEPSILNYEEYIQKLRQVVEKHQEKLMKGYQKFLNSKKG